MSYGQFEIKILDLQWINDEDDPNDLCAHGQVYLKIGEEVISDKESGYWNLSSAALSLMRTIERDYKKGDFGNQLLPCCGHFIIADDIGESVTIHGCPSGIDWSIIHRINIVEHITDKGQVGIIDKKTYKKVIYDFADRVEQFYRDSLPKIIPDCDFDQTGYLTFWKEWKRLRNKE
jgi:hypothetical protein